MPGLPHRISTLLYGFNAQDDVLLLHRAQDPNLGLWSPPGGKLDVASGESPYACGCREVHEELGLVLRPTDLHLTGVVSERGYGGAAHWLMFLFEIRPRLEALPPPHREGTFAFVPRASLHTLPLPPTDAEQIWPLFWRHRGGFFSAHCRCGADGTFQWELEESRPEILR